MFRNYLMTALRNLARNWLYASISIFGLAIAFAGAILIAQFIRNEFTYDRWIPDYQHIYKVTVVLAQPGQPPQPADASQGQFAGQLKVAHPEIIASRIDQDFPTLHQRPGDDGVVDQTFAWADPNIFDVLQLPAAAGDLKTALVQPDTVVMTRRAARLYFGDDAPIGKTLDLQSGTDHHPMRVTAILKDYPSNTSLVAEILASGKSAYSGLAQIDLHPSLGNIGPTTFVRVPASMEAGALQHILDVTGQPETAFFKQFANAGFNFHYVPLADIHLSPRGNSIVVKPVGSKATALAIATVGLLIIVVAAINFVTLMTARANRRAAEVGIRKVNGATRADLIIQFLGEALIYSFLSMVIASALAAVLFKPFSAFVQRDLDLNFIRDPALALGLLGATLVIGLLGGLYPAFVLSSFRPAVVLKGGLVQTAGSMIARQALVVVQFAILIGLILSTVTIYRQTQFALNQGMGAKRDLIMQVWTACSNAFPDEVARLPGVAQDACSSQTALNVPYASNITQVRTNAGEPTSFNIAAIDYGFFDVYAIKPLAGRVFDRAHGAEGALAGPGGMRPPPPPGSPPPAGPPPVVTVQPPVILNETAVRLLGYASPAAAIGKQLTWQQFAGGPNGAMTPSEIVGVVPDLPSTVKGGVNPLIYFNAPRFMIGMLSVRMTGKDMPGTVQAIQRTWKATGNIRPIQVMFLAQNRRIQYLDIIIQGTAIAICAAAAIVIACLGLFALSAYTTERRTKEIGIRKVMGASTFDVVRLLVSQFTVPVVIAILIACPVGYLAMTHWLTGFVSHVAIAWWSVALAAGVALIVAWLTVSLQSFKAASAKPVLALRYE